MEVKRKDNTPRGIAEDLQKAHNDATNSRSHAARKAAESTEDPKKRYSVMSKALARFKEQEAALRKQEQQLSEDYARRSTILQERERELSNREKLLSIHSSEERKKFHAWREEEQRQIAEEKNVIDQIKSTLIEEQKRQSEDYKKLLERNSAAYVDSTLGTLRKRLSELNDKAEWWRNCGAIAIALGLLFLVASAISLNPLDPGLEWSAIAYISLRGFILVALIGYFATYAASSERILRSEAAKIDGRIHAIDYGAFYLKTYGANADWEQVKEAFKDWNESSEPSPQDIPPNKSGSPRADRSPPLRKRRIQ